MKYLSARCESLQQHCENLYDWQDQLSSATRELDDHLDRLDAFSRKNNLRFFNVREGPGEDYKSCARKVVQLLNRFFPFKTWRPEDLEQAHRVGPKRKDGSRPRTLVARFHTWPDKLSLLEEKDARKDMADTYGIRMAVDLTDRQHKELKRQEDHRRIAYYRNGRLCFKEKRRSSRRGSPAGHDRRQHERMRQRQHHDHPEHSREHERTPDNTPPPTVDMNEYPALQRQQVPPTDHQQLQTMETQGPIAASTPGLPKSAHETTLEDTTMEDKFGGHRFGRGRNSQRP